MGTWKFIVSRSEVWVAPETGGWHLKWRRSCGGALRLLWGMMLAPGYPAGLRELVSAYKCGHEY